jgi:serine/threonine protein kinase
MLSSNQVLNQGRYRVINQFGKLESESLYEAYDTFSETKVVLRETVGHLGKVATAAQIENAKTTFAADAKRLAEVEHPALLKVRDYFSEIDRQYLVLEACESTDLTDLVEKSEKPLPLSDVLRWANQLLEGLAHLHSKSPLIVHQRVCPQNIRLTSNFTVKLLLTGTDAAEVSADADQTYRSLEQLWLTLDSASQKMIANSFGERSEEVLRQAPDARTDVYSAGATIYFLLTRTVPENALNRYMETLDGNDDPLLPPSALDPAIPAEISEIVMKAMELKREYRFENASKFKGELAKFKAPAKTVEAAPSPAPVPVETRKDEVDLDAERYRVEKERAELEAEELRLAERRAQIEKQKQELDAERRTQADALEAKRLDEEKSKAAKLEAERLAAEKQRAEKLAAEKLLAEQKAAAELKAKAELEQKARSKSETKDKTPLATPENHEVEKLQEALALDDLLDLPEHVSEPAAKPERVSDVFALDTETTSQIASSEPEMSYDLFAGPEKSGSFIGRPLVIGGVGVMALVIAVGVWMFAGGSSKPSASPAATVQAPIEQTVTSEPVQNSVTSPEPTQAETLSVDSQSPATTEPNAQAAADAKKREQLAKEKLKQQQAQAKPTPEKKKSVTVDDLINDN